jgi:hypothetical protein
MLFDFVEAVFADFVAMNLSLSSPPPFAKRPLLKHRLLNVV